MRGFPALPGKRRLCLLPIVAMLAVAGCEKGKTPSAEEVARVQMGMSVAEAEAILGRGKVIQESEVPGRRADHRPRPDITWRRWGLTDQQYLCLGFRADKLYAYEAHNLPSITDPNLPPEQQARVDLSKLNTELMHYALRNNSQLPPDADALAEYLKFEPALLEKLRAGVYVVVWGASNTHPMLAYEKDVAEKGGIVLQAHGKVQKMTADQFKAALSKEKSPSPTKAKNE